MKKILIFGILLLLPGCEEKKPLVPLEYTGWKDRKALAAELKTIYRAETAEKALAALEAFSQGPWGKKYPPTMSYRVVAQKGFFARSWSQLTGSV